MTQMLLFPDPRPLVERLGAEFFRQAPESAGVYLMRDGAGAVLYVGKAKNLRRRLASYRVANPDRLARRQLRLLRAVESIELRPCDSEASALAKEAELLRNLRPRFNRAGTWPGAAWFLVWRTTPAGLELGIGRTVEPGWHFHGPAGAGVIHLRAALLRLLWRALVRDGTLAAMPWGWLRGQAAGVAVIPRSDANAAKLEEVAAGLKGLLSGEAEPFLEWLSGWAAAEAPLFEKAVWQGDLERVSEFARRQALR